MFKRGDAHADDFALVMKPFCMLDLHSLPCAAQALRNLTLEGDPEVLRREVARLTAELAALRGGRNAAALELMSNELAAANEAGSGKPHGLCCTYELFTAHHQVAPSTE
jgi:hypothetical protein